jgi:Zn-dependent protease with chaperone function
MLNRIADVTIIAVAVVLAPIFAIITLTFQIILADRVAANGLLTLTVREPWRPQAWRAQRTGVLMLAAVQFHQYTFCRLAAVA